MGQTITWRCEMLFQIHDVVEIKFGHLQRFKDGEGCKSFATVDVNVKTEDGKEFRLTCFVKENVKLRHMGDLITFPK